MKKILKGIMVIIIICVYVVVLKALMTVETVDISESQREKIEAQREEKQFELMLKVTEEYESLHPEYAEVLNLFLATGEPNVLTEEHKTFIKAHVYEIEEPYRTIFLETIDEVEISSMIEEEIEEGRAGYFNPNEGKIYFQRISELLEYISDREPWGSDMRNVLIHEVAHAIDFYYGKNNYITKTYTMYSEVIGKEVTLQEAIIYDVYTCLENKIRSHTSDERGIDNILQSFHYKDDTTEHLTTEEKGIRNLVIREFQHGDTVGIIEELYCRVAGSAFEPDFGGLPFSAGFHAIEYYWDENGEPNGTMASELWAEYFSDIAAYKSVEEVEKRMIKYLPESYMILQAITEEIVQKIEP